MQVKYARLEQGTRRAITKLSNMLRGSWYGMDRRAMLPNLPDQLHYPQGTLTILYWFIIDLLAIDFARTGASNVCTGTSLMQPITHAGPSYTFEVSDNWVKTLQRY